MPFAVQFTANRQWIEAAFQQATDLGGACKGEASRKWNSCIPWVLALFQHDSMDSLQRYHSNVVQIKKLKDCLPSLDMLMQMSRATSLGDFSKQCRPLVQQRLRIRSNSIVVRSPNALSNGFLPPPAGGIASSAAALFRARTRSGDLPYSWRVRLASYLILLTIHPFEDGNGRAARLLFAADTLSNDGPLEDLMALILLHANASTAFHVAAKCARLGDFCMLFTCFEEMRLRAHALFGNSFAELEAALVQNDQKEVCYVSAKIHADAHAQLKMNRPAFPEILSLERRVQ